MGTGSSSPHAISAPGKGLMREALGPRPGLGSGPATRPPLPYPGRLIQPRSQAGGHGPGARAASDAADGRPAGRLPPSAVAAWGLRCIHHGGR